MANFSFQAAYFSFPVTAAGGHGSRTEALILAVCIREKKKKTCQAKISCLIKDAAEAHGAEDRLREIKCDR